MHKNTILRTALSIACLLTVSGIASADTKVKSRQTSGGQTYENTSYIKGKRQRSENSGGQMITIEQCDLRRNIQIMPMAKAYVITPYDDGTPGSTGNSTNTHTTQPGAVKKGGVVTSTVITKDTGERKQMFGYTARHIITTMSMESSPDACSQNNTKMEIDGWYIDATFALDCDSNRQYTAYRPPTAAGGCRDRYETKTIGTAKKGFPVYEKMTMLGANGAPSFSNITEVIEISQATLEQSLFEPPPDYRQVEDFASAFSAAYANPQASAGNTGISTGVNPSMSQPTAAPASTVGPKRAGVIRIGVVAVKPGNVTEGMNPQQLALAVQNTLMENLKSSNVEAIPIDGAGGIQAEAKQKDCDYLVFANVALKKGGGGFGSFMNSAAGKVASNVGYGSSTAAVVATNAVVAATVAENIKSKDEMTLDVRLERPGATTSTFAQQYKGKAKSAGEDLITPLVQQAAQAVLAAAK
ncbi:MAG TPA: hypothetical protein VFI24_25760 [Pyrinomonadaceae bacterium]|nr:hypothetical protein [Pyrinomonadaceae bacterium]